MILYIDPGSGSLLTQVAVAGAAGAAVAVRMGWRRATARLGGKRHREEEPATDERSDAPAAG